MNDLFVSVTEIARRHGISKAAVSKAVADYVRDHGLEVQRGGKGGVVRGVNAVQFAAIRNRFNDSAKARTIAQTVPDLPMPSASLNSLDEERRQKLVVDRSLASLRLHEEAGRLVRKDVISDALVTIGADLVRTLDLQRFADDIAAAIASGGVHGLRVKLKQIGHRIREDIAAQLDIAASLATSGDDMLAVPELEEA